MKVAEEWEKSKEAERQAAMSVALGQIARDVGRKPRTRITAAEVESKIQQLREDFQGAFANYHREALVPYITSVVRAIKPRLPWWKRIRVWLRVRMANRRLEKRVKKYAGSDPGTTPEKKTPVPLVTAMRLKPSQRIHWAHKGYTRALCGERVDHNRPVDEALRICVSCKRAKKKLEAEDA